MAETVVVPSRERLMEEAIVARLAAVCPSLEVLPYPDDPSAFNVTHPVGTVLVVYRGSEFGPPESCSHLVFQEETLTFEVVLLVRNLRTHAEGYDLLFDVRRALLGWRALSGLDPAFLKSVRLQGVVDGLWQWGGLFAWVGKTVQDVVASLSEDLPPAPLVSDDPLPSLSRPLSLEELPP